MPRTTRVAYWRTSSIALTVESPRSLLRMERFLDRKGLSVSLPFVVIMNDVSTQQTHTHKVIHGEALVEWLQDILRGIAEHGPAALPQLRQSVFSNLSMVTLSLAALCVRPDHPPPSTPPAAMPQALASATPPPPPNTETPPQETTFNQGTDAEQIQPQISRSNLPAAFARSNNAVGLPIPPIRTAVKSRGRSDHNHALPE